MDPAQRFANRTVVRLIARPVLGKTMRQNHRTVDRPNHFKRADQLRIASQTVPAVRPGNRPQNSSFRQLLQDFSQQRDGQMIRIRNVFGAGRGVQRSQVPQSDQTVVRFFGELEQIELGPFVS